MKPMISQTATISFCFEPKKIQFIRRLNASKSAVEYLKSICFKYSLLSNTFDAFNLFWGILIQTPREFYEEFFGV